MITDLTTSAACAAPAAREFLAFRLGDEEYGIDILRVQEIRSYEAPTHIANAPPFIRGVVDLRGVIVPIVDLRMKFELDRCDIDGSTVVIVLNLAARVVGIVVDAVCDVVTLDAQRMRPVPAFNGRIRADHLSAIGTLDDRMLILMDIEKLMASADMGLASVAPG